ncbi:hypothetical protein KJ616_02995 [Patescibacteria group bacterium]|nr:hypothetical protein [Patescibacteria group bacterium]
MPGTIETSVMAATRKLIWVRGVPIDLDQSALVAMKELYNNDLVAQIPPERWSGDESEQAELAERGIINKAKVDIPIWYPRKRFSTIKGRQFLLDGNLGYGLPFFLTPLKDKKIGEALQEIGIWAVAALGQSDDKLWLVRDRPRAAYLCLGEHSVGFGLGYATDHWRDSDAVVGFPQVSNR